MKTLDSHIIPEARYFTYVHHGYAPEQHTAAMGRDTQPYIQEALDILYKNWTVYIRLGSEVIEFNMMGYGCGTTVIRSLEIFESRPHSTMQA